MDEMPDKPVRELESLIQSIGACEPGDLEFYKRVDRLNSWINEDPANGSVFSKAEISPDIRAEIAAFNQLEAFRDADSMMFRSRLSGLNSGRKKVFWMAAASLVFMMMIGGGYLFFKDTPAAAVPGSATLAKNDVQPGGNRATLTLANGMVIVLDSTQNGTLGNEGGTKILKINPGQLSYSSGANSERTSETAYNTISTPRGGRYQVMLPDGTMVWLNSSSSLKFFTSFSGQERKVELTGEAYFEIAKAKSANATVPFTVKVGDKETVKVLGTSFNIMAFDDEASLQTTLVNGSVQLVKGDNVLQMKPGQQARTGNLDNSISIRSDVDLEEVLAWKNGMFVFKDTDIYAIMKQVERWYDVKVSYAAGSRNSSHFMATIPRGLPVSKLLTLLELTNRVHFKIEGKEITVLP